MPEPGTTAVPVPPPATLSLTATRDGSTLVVRSVFPTLYHLLDAARAGVLLALGLLLAVLASLARQGRVVLLGPWAGMVAMVLTAGALLLALGALSRLRAVRPIELRLGLEGLTLLGPPGAPLSAEEAAPLARPRGGRMTLSWDRLERIEQSASGLVFRGRGGSLLVPWRYRRPRPRVGLRAGLNAPGELALPAFRYDELDWLAAVAERYRAGDAGAVEDLCGVRAPGLQPPVPLGESSPFSLRGMGPARLRLLVVLAVAALAILVARAYDALPRF